MVNFLLSSSFRTISSRFHILSTFQTPFLWARREMEEKMVLITRAIMEAQLQLKNLAWNATLWLHQSTVRFMCRGGSWLSTGCDIMTYFTVLYITWFTTWAFCQRNSYLLTTMSEMSHEAKSHPQWIMITFF